MSVDSDGALEQGALVWVIEKSGARRAARYMGQSETTSWLGGKVALMVVYEDTRTGAAVDADRVVARDSAEA
jgi:hypothetical protein